MKFVQAKHYYPGGTNSPHWIVIHDMEYPEKPTGAEWCADFFAGLNGLTAPKASAHYCVDNDSIVQCVNDADGAWHTPGSLAGKEINRFSIGIEHSGYARQTAEEWRDAYSSAELEMSARLVAELCMRHGIPPIRLTAEQLKSGERGIAGHADFTKATGKGDHWDPGPNFPWDWYMERVVAHYGEAPQEAVPPPDQWVEVTCKGVRYFVAPIYFPFVGIGQAADIAQALGCELPTPDLVDAIYEAADLKINASKIVINDHDGTPETMASAATFARVNKRIEEQMAGRSLGVDFKLLAGAFKDVVRTEDGKLGIYGWQRADGTPIQGPQAYTKHARGWIDYSQGLRLVRRA